MLYSLSKRGWTDCIIMHLTAFPSYRLSDCQVTHERCTTLASALKSSSSHLRHLDLSRNRLKDLGVRLLCVGVKSANCKLESLRWVYCHPTLFTKEIGRTLFVSKWWCNICHILYVNCTDFKAVNYQTAAVVIWPPLWGPTPPIWNNWTWEKTGICRIQEWRSFVIFWTV